MNYPLLSLPAALFIINLLFTAYGVAEGFGYHSADQRYWKKRHSGCNGKMQSPVSISTRKAIPLKLPALEMVGYHNPLPAPLKLTNNGHSVSLSIPKAGKGERTPFIFGGKLTSEYELEGLHFHWGDRNNRGSEHVLNDIRYPMEMHIIHKNIKYATAAEAYNHHDGLTVLAFFYQIQDEEAKELSPLIRNLSTIEEVNAEMILNTTFPLSSLIRINTDRFYTYKGSLTTPPCSEAVTWIVFPDSLPISIYQMEKFRLLSASSERMLVDNFRNLQPLHNRRIFVRIAGSNSARVQRVNNVHYTKWDWLKTDAFEDDFDNEISNEIF